MLALRWPFGPWPQDAGLLDTGPVGHWSLSALVALALVAVGSGWCEKPLNQPVAIQRLIECTVQMKPTVPSKNMGHGDCQITAFAAIAPLFPFGVWVGSENAYKSSRRNAPSGWVTTARWVAASDMIALFLLQARLVEGLSQGYADHGKIPVDRGLHRQPHPSRAERADWQDHLSQRCATDGLQ